jgi:hypothetical protein
MSNENNTIPNTAYRKRFAHLQYDRTSMNLWEDDKSRDYKGF